MDEEAGTYCYRCGRRTDDPTRYCQYCGALTTLSRADRTLGVAFVLNELERDPMADLVAPVANSRLRVHYGDLLDALSGRPALARSAEPVAPTPTPTLTGLATPAPEYTSAPGGAADRPRAAAAPRPPAPPREPMDWSWLVDQQANLFLFAGAFLTVVAALIYVGYSGQAVDGALKMALLSIYTIAFLVAGIVCLRLPRVEIAGRVFFAVGAVLLPLNFVAARSLLADESLSLTTMWLSGSVVTAVFYASVACLGLGKPYAFASGAAIVSATMAAVVRSGMPVEWAPLCFIAVAAGMALAAIAAPKVVRASVGDIWSAQSRVVALAAMLAAVLIAPFVGDGELLRDNGDVARTFLPLTFAMFAAYAALLMLSARDTLAGLATLAGVGGTIISIAYALHLPAEYYPFGFVIVALSFGGVVSIVRDARVGDRLPDGASDALHTGAMCAALAAAAIAVLSVVAAADGRHSANAYHVQSRWFLPATFLALAAYGAIPMLVQRRREGAVIVVASAAGAAMALVYAMRWPAEYYAVMSGGIALTFALTGMSARRGTVAARVAPDTAHVLRAAGFLASLAAGAVALGIVVAAGGDSTAYVVDSRWFMLAAFGLTLAHFVVDAFGCRERDGVSGVVLASAAVCAALVYALDVSAEYYAFAAIAPAVVLAAIARITSIVAARGDERSVITRASSRLAAGWQDDVFFCGRGLVFAGVAVGLGAVWAAEQHSASYEPQFRAFLPVAFGLVAVFLAIDASHSRRAEISTAFVVAAIAAVVGIPYALHAGPAYYGASFALAAALMAFGGRVVQPSWLDTRGRDVLAAASMTIAWLPFEGAYADAPRIGASVHFAAAAFYTLAAVFDIGGEMTLGRVAAAPTGVRGVRASIGWLYAAGLVAAIGYLHALNGLSPSDDAGGSGSIAMPMFTVAIVLWFAGIGVRRVRPDFRLHCYVMSLAAALVSLAAAGSTRDLTILLTSYAGMSVLIAVLDDEPLLGAPAALLGIGVFGIWQRQLDVALWSVPVALSIAGVGMCVVSRLLPQRWSTAMITAGGAYAALAPAAGVVLLAQRGSGGAPYYETGIYESVAITLAVFGALVTAASARSYRWLVLAGTAIAVAALLLQIGRFHPENGQAYTLVAGGYLVLAGTFGLAKLRLAPSLTAAAPIVEGLGAAIIMLPSFLQSFDAGWRYEWILLAEASGFFIAGVAVRRRGLLSVALAALVLVAGHALFDAVNALPNWVVVATAGAAMLAIGMAILVGRDRWSIWQASVVRWWGDAADPISG